MSHLSFEEHDGMKFYYRHFETDSEIGLIWIHGLGEHVDRYEHCFEVWSKKLEIITYDQRGFGQTVLQSNSPLGHNYGWDVVLDDVVYFSQKLKAKKIFIGGHSMGGLIALSVLDKMIKESNKEILGVFATSPAIKAGPATDANGFLKWIVSWLSVILPTMGLPRPVPAELLCHDPAVNKAYSVDSLVHPHMSFLTGNSLLNAGKDLIENAPSYNPTNVPVLIVFGSVDMIANPEAAEKFIESIKTTDKTYKLHEGMKHELHNEPRVKEEVIQYNLDWMLSRVK
eukprot:NODE_483_length_7824_cov_0.163625.p3 type:complete len:284 gc:universal NODE_483_length_7824_cov_0.163625:4393-5244(+)